MADLEPLKKVLAVLWRLVAFVFIGLSLLLLAGVGLCFIAVFDPNSLSFLTDLGDMVGIVEEVAGIVIFTLVVWGGSKFFRRG